MAIRLGFQAYQGDILLVPSLRDYCACAICVRARRYSGRKSAKIALEYSLNLTYFKEFVMKIALSKMLVATSIALSLSALAYAEKLKVGATPVPQAEMLRFIAPDLQKAGIELEVVEFTDYILPNIALNEKSIDANFMQHKPFLDKISADRKLDLVSIAQIHIEPIGGYSKRIKDIKELKNGATILIPNDPTNGGRALILLHNNGLIKLKDPSNLSAKETDIIDNPKKLKIKALEAALLPKTLQKSRPSYC